MHRWGVTTSPDTLAWSLNTWIEGQEECEADIKGLEDFNDLLQTIHEDLMHNKSKTGGVATGAPASASATAPTEDAALQTPSASASAKLPDTPSGFSTQLRSGAKDDKNRLPLDQYQELRARDEAVISKIHVWLGVTEQRGKLGALCRRYLCMGGYTEHESHAIPAYESLTAAKKP